MPPPPSRCPALFCLRFDSSATSPLPSMHVRALGAAECAAAQMPAHTLVPTLVWFLTRGLWPRRRRKGTLNLRAEATVLRAYSRTRGPRRQRGSELRMLAGTCIRGTLNGVREGRVAGRRSGRKSVLDAVLYRSLRSSSLVPCASLSWIRRLPFVAFACQEQKEIMMLLHNHNVYFPIVSFLQILSLVFTSEGDLSTIQSLADNPRTVERT